jgi:antitoxin MazE
MDTDMRGQIGKWGNSLAVRIPSAVAREAAIDEGRTVQIKAKAGSIVVTPEEVEPRYSLEELLAGMTKENLHEEIDSGPAVGNEEL